MGYTTEIEYIRKIRECRKKEEQLMYLLHRGKLRFSEFLKKLKDIQKE